MYYFIDVWSEKVPKGFITNILQLTYQYGTKHMPISWVWSLFVYSVNTLKSDRRVTLSNPTWSSSKPIRPGAKTSSKHSLLCPVVPSVQVFPCFTTYLCRTNMYVNWYGTAFAAWIQSQPRPHMDSPPQNTVLLRVLSAEFCYTDWIQNKSQLKHSYFRYKHNIGLLAQKRRSKLKMAACEYFQKWFHSQVLVNSS